MKWGTQVYVESLKSTNNVLDDHSSMHYVGEWCILLIHDTSLFSICIGVWVDVKQEQSCLQMHKLQLYKKTWPHLDIQYFHAWVFIDALVVGAYNGQYCMQCHRRVEEMILGMFYAPGLSTMFPLAHSMQPNYSQWTWSTASWCVPSII